MQKKGMYEEDYTETLLSWPSPKESTYKYVSDREIDFLETNFLKTYLGTGS